MDHRRLRLSLTVGELSCAQCQASVRHDGESTSHLRAVVAIADIIKHPIGLATSAEPHAGSIPQPAVQLRD